MGTEQGAIQAMQDQALRDAISSMIYLDEATGCAANYVATFCYGDDANEIHFAGSDALDCCLQFIAWYHEGHAPAEAAQ